MIRHQIIRFIKTSPYKTLGISPNSSKEQIKSAYYRLAKRYHPDINSQYKVKPTKEYFQDISSAYKELEKNNFKITEEIEENQYQPPRYDSMPKYHRFRRRPESSRDSEQNSKYIIVFEILTGV